MLGTTCQLACVGRSVAVFPGQHHPAKPGGAASRWTCRGGRHCPDRSGADSPSGPWFDLPDFRRSATAASGTCPNVRTACYLTTTCRSGGLFTSCRGSAAGPAARPSRPGEDERADINANQSRNLRAGGTQCRRCGHSSAQAICVYIPRNCFRSAQCNNLSEQAFDSISDMALIHFAFSPIRA